MNAIGSPSPTSSADARQQASPSAWAQPAIATAEGAKILVAGDESDQRVIVTTCLEGAGYAPIAGVLDKLVLNMARTVAAVVAARNAQTLRQLR